MSIKMRPVVVFDSIKTHTGTHSRFNTARQNAPQPCSHFPASSPPQLRPLTPRGGNANRNPRRTCAAASLPPRRRGVFREDVRLLHDEAAIEQIQCLERRRRASSARGDLAGVGAVEGAEDVVELHARLVPIRP